MPDFSSNVLLTAEVELRVQDRKLRSDLAKAKQEVNRATDAMTKASIAKMKDKARANMRIDKLEKQQALRGVQAQIATNNDQRRAARQLASEKRKMATEESRRNAQHAKQQNAAKARIGRLSSSFRMLGVQVAIAGAIITATFAKMLKEFSVFDTAMRRATAVSDTSLSQYNKMSSMAEKASVDLNLAATNTADAFYFLGSAGLNAEQQMAAFVPVVTLAKAAVIEAGQAAEIMVDTMKGFKISFEETGHVAAVMAKSVISSNMNFLQLGETLSLVAGVANATNNTLEETSAMIQLMANVGIKGTRAGTTLRRSMLNLSAPSEKVSRAFEDMGIAISDQSGKIKPYIQLVGEISDSLHDATEEQKQMAFKTLFGARAIAGQLEIFGAGPAVLRDMVLDLQLVGDTHEEIANKQMMAFSEQVGVMHKKVSNMSRHLTSTFVPALKSMSEWLGKGADKFTKWADEHEAMAGALTGTGIAMGGLLAISGSLITTLASLSLIANAFATVTLGGLILALGAATIAIAALVAGIVFVINKMAIERERIKKLSDEYDTNDKKIKAMTASLKEYKDTLGDLEITPEMQGIQDKMETVKEKIKKANFELSKFTDGLKRIRSVSEKSLMINLKQRGLKAPKEESMTSQFASFGTPGSKVDAKAAMLLLIKDTRKTIKELTDEYKGLRDNKITAEQEALEAKRNADRESLGSTKVWTRETLEEIVGMFNEIRGMPEVFGKASMQLLELEKSKMISDFKKREFIDEKSRAKELAEFEVTVNAWAASKLEKIEIEAAKRSESFHEGYMARLREIKNETKTMGEVGAEAADIMQGAMADMFSGITKDARNWKDVMLNVIRSVENALIDLAAQQLAAKMMGGGAQPSGGGGSTMGVLTSVVGGLMGGGLGTATTGTTGLGSSNTNALAGSTQGSFFKFQHSGGHTGSSGARKPVELKDDEFATVLQSGERVKRRGDGPDGNGGGSQTNVSINITAMDSKSVFQAIKPLKKELTSLVQSASRDNHSIRRS